MKRRVPVLPTLVVAVAAAIMVILGIWQLQRAAWKEDLLARYAAAAQDDQPVVFPVANQQAAEATYYRRSSVDCSPVAGDWRSVAGRNARGEAGYVHIVLCAIDNGAPQRDRTAYVQAGWSQDPNPPQWDGGLVEGRIGPNTEGFAKLVANPPVAGLEASAAPDPNDLPNNHLAYAVQWFLFAGIALVIYTLALRRRWRGN